VKDDLAAGLKVAMQRGDNLEKAMQSFINAGYNPQEVRAAGNLVSQGASHIVQPKAVEKKPTENPPKSLPAAPQKKVEKKSIIILGLLIFSGAIGYLVYTLVIAK
jgi:hypothetical protein